MDREVKQPSPSVAAGRETLPGCGMSTMTTIAAGSRSRPRQRPFRAISAPAGTMTIFGAGGDLTKRLVVPALYNLVQSRQASGRASPSLASIITTRPPRTGARA